MPSYDFAVVFDIVFAAPIRERDFFKKKLCEFGILGFRTIQGNSEEEVLSRLGTLRRILFSITQNQ